MSCEVLGESEVTLGFLAGGVGSVRDPNSHVFQGSILFIFEMWLVKIKITISVLAGMQHLSCEPKGNSTFTF